MSSPVSPATGPAVELLHELCGRDGIHASTTLTTNYRAVFTRDAVMAGIAGVVLDDDVVKAALVATLERLRALQGASGQIASNYSLTSARGGPRVSFGTLTPKLDAPCWYLIGVGVAARAGLIEAADFRDSVSRSAGLLDAVEYNGSDLYYVPAGGDWADEYVYEGYILSDQVLRAWGLRLVGEVFEHSTWARKADAIRRRIDATYWPRRYDPIAAACPIASFTPARRWDVFDLAACSLLGASRLLPDRAAAALEWIAGNWLQRGELPPAFAPVIEPGERDWESLRGFHLFEFKNHPHRYHNGGIWPIWLGWLGVALAGAGDRDGLRRLRSLVREVTRAMPDYQYDEYLSGDTYEPGGTRWMAYTATGLILLESAERAAEVLR